jgi:cytoskeletal protein CcmA (bactofilin family)
MGRGILIILAGFIITFGIVEGSMHHRQRQAATRTPDYYYAEQSRNIAFSMMEAALSKFNNDWSLGKGEEWEHSILNGTGSVSYYKHPAGFGSRLFVQVRGVIMNDTTTIRAIINRPAFSQYAYFTDVEPEINFGTDDKLYGPVHTNGTFHINGQPKFYGKVSSPNEPNGVPKRCEYSGNKNKDCPHFYGGTDFKSYNIELPSDLSNISDDAKDGGYHYNDDMIKVIFKEDGTADITRFRRGQYHCVKWKYYRYGKKCIEYSKYHEISSQNYDLSASGFNGIISSSGNIEVKGTVKGNVTVHSAKDIHIIGDLTYKDFDPNQDYSETKLSSQNLLGLVSQNDVIVDDNAEKDHGSKNLYITASIMASQGSFTVEDYNSSHIGFRGDLYILGGVIQRTRGAVATGNRYGISTGYAKHYVYDKRFQTNQTPDFPTVKRFSVDSWRETTK